jgi:hypothetical protein
MPLASNTIIGVEVTELSTNKQHTLKEVPYATTRAHLHTYKHAQ